MTTVAITGAGNGIGLALARRLHAGGARVALLDVDTEAVEAAAERLGDRARAFTADVGDGAATEAAMAAASAALGGLDVVVANAGISMPLTPLAGLDPDRFERIMDVNVNGVWRTVRPALPELMERRGQIVLLSSVYAWFNGNFVAPYAASKAAVEQLGRALQVELAPWGVATTIAHFSFVQTDLVRGQESPVLDALLDGAPGFLKRRLSPEQVAAMLADGIERRAPRVIAPAWCRVLHRLEGVVSPLMDRQMLRDRKRSRVLVEQTPDAPAPVAR